MSRFFMMLMLLLVPLIVIYSVIRYVWAVAFNPVRAKLILIAYDQLINTLFNGDPDEMISSRAGKAQIEGRTWGCVLCQLLNKLDPDHCRRSIEYDEGRKISKQPD